MAQMASYASDPQKSRGRRHDEGRAHAGGRVNDGLQNGGAMRGPRDDFQRDRDRIIHSISFRLLRHKTQVFVALDGDHYRWLFTHILEVGQMARTMAPALGLNKNLTQ